MFVVSMVMSVHLSHVIAHPFQLHGSSKEVELMKARDVGIESLLGARLDMLVHQGVIDTRSTLACDLLQNGIVNALQLQDFLADVLIHVVVASLVAHIDVEVINLRVNLPFCVPHLCHSHADIHHPAQRGRREVLKFTVHQI